MTTPEQFQLLVQLVWSAAVIGFFVGILLTFFEHR